ncbi:MAG: hypothetical protein LBJ02_10665, partial [Bifidobacteriaceae bacterium]|nr:hypothetical protein [Bifidobacteriaceae bacterium]
ASRTHLDGGRGTLQVAVVRALDMLASANGSGHGTKAALDLTPATRLAQPARQRRDLRLHS